MMDHFINSSISGLASYLVHHQFLEIHEAELYEKEAKKQAVSLITYLVKNSILSAKSILDCCSKTFNLPIFDLREFELDEIGLNAEFMQRWRVIPLKKTNKTIYIGISDPTNRLAINAVEFCTGLTPVTHLVLEDQLDTLLNKYNEALANHHQFEISLLKDLIQEEAKTVIQENSIHYDEPLIKVVNHVIQFAFQQTASDIHIEPFETFCQIRYRQDGILYEMATIPINLAQRVATRLKVMAGLDISERRMPQDGRFQFENKDIRINTCPTLFGEKIVLRLLNKLTLTIDELGLTSHQKIIFFRKISQPNGMILVTGPTGSGKTVTLYAALKALNNKEKNILTIEEPVEIQLEGINQVNVNSKIGLQFATALRSFLRQDPDILMVGEIRDLETAEIAIQAAQTGHLVLSTLHTNSAIETITRLISMGVPAYNIISSVSLIIAQRLLRKLCNHCKQVDTFSSSSSQIYHAVGCSQCLQGYSGRIAVYECLLLNENLKKLILMNENLNTLAENARKEGFISLHDMAVEKIKEGVTSLVEVHRVIGK